MFKVFLPFNELWFYHCYTFREEWIRAIQAVANGLKSQEDDEPMEFGSPGDNSLEGIEAAIAKSRTKVVSDLE